MGRCRRRAPVPPAARAPRQPPQMRPLTPGAHAGQPSAHAGWPRPLAWLALRHAPPVIIDRKQGQQHGGCKCWEQALGPARTLTASDCRPAPHAHLIACQPQLLNQRLQPFDRLRQPLSNLEGRRRDSCSIGHSCNTRPCYCTAGNECMQGLGHTHPPTELCDSPISEGSSDTCSIAARRLAPSDPPTRLSLATAVMARAYAVSAAAKACGR